MEKLLSSQWKIKSSKTGWQFSQKVCHALSHMQYSPKWVHQRSLISKFLCPGVRLFGTLMIIMSSFDLVLIQDQALTWEPSPLGDKVSMLTHIYPHKARRKIEDWSYAKSPGWQPTLCVALCLICWFALAFKSMVIHDTECPYWDQVSLNNTNQTKPSLESRCSNREIRNAIGVQAILTRPSKGSKKSILLRMVVSSWP